MHLMIKMTFSEKIGHNFKIYNKCCCSTLNFFADDDNHSYDNNDLLCGVIVESGLALFTTWLITKGYLHHKSQHDESNNLFCKEAKLWLNLREVYNNDNPGVARCLLLFKLSTSTFETYQGFALVIGLH